MTSAGSLGLLFPPCLPLILYAIIAHVPVREMFLAGALPGVLLVVMTACWGIYIAPPRSKRSSFNLKKALRASWNTKWEVLLPLVALGSLLGGLATPLEAAAVTAAYALFVATVIHRDLHILRDVPRVTVECGVLVGGILLILGVALGFTNYLIEVQLPARAVEWATARVHSPLLFLLLLNLFLLVVGCLMHIFSAIIVVVPLIVPLGVAFGINPLHLGIIFLANLELGYLMPPVGMNLFLSAYRFNRPMAEVVRAVLPTLAVMFLGVLLITYWPALTTWLPTLFR
jgi:tripartite ATP-independent transporter DctM subunit